MVDKKGQQSIGMSFNMIFSIFLIVVFVIVAFIAVRIFLDFGEKATVGDFYLDLQDKVDDAWQSQVSESTFEINLPSGIEFICFANLSAEITAFSGIYEDIGVYDYYDSNLFLYPPGEAEDMPHRLIDHLNISKITSLKNPYCVEATGELKIKKDFYDKSVLIE